MEPNKKREKLATTSKEAITVSLSFLTTESRLKHDNKATVQLKKFLDTLHHKRKKLQQV